VRITAQLIDALTDTHLWADRFDGSLEDIFELQDKVAISVTGVIEPTLQSAEIRRSANRPTNDLTAYDLYLRALPAPSSFDKDRITRHSTSSGKRSSAIHATALPSLSLQFVTTNSISTAGPTTGRHTAA
jgi:hypothetical protein